MKMKMTQQLYVYILEYRQLTLKNTHAYLIGLQITVKYNTVGMMQSYTVATLRD